MICPACGVNDQQKIIDTRRRSTEYILRRRECCFCGNKFNTVEVMELNEKTMSVLRREMKHNCPSRAFEKIIYSVYHKLFGLEKKTV